jgi:hypothetical protein
VINSIAAFEAHMKNPKARVHFAVCRSDLDTPGARAEGLLNIANQCLTAGTSVPANTCGWPKYFLLYHAVEAALKAYLARSGMADSELRDIGHDIKPLATEAEKRGFTLHADEKTVLNRFECSNFDPSVAMRYEYFGSPSCPTFDNLVHVADAILSRA